MSDSTNLRTLVERASKLRDRYHELERRQHGSEWTTEEDALAFLTDAGLVGRWTMSRSDRWPMKGTDQLEHKLAECLWWLVVLARRQNIDLFAAFERFLDRTEARLS